MTGARRHTAGIALLLLAAWHAAGAADVQKMRVSRDDAYYTIAAVMIIAVPPATAFRAASDYERLPEFNPSIVSSRRLGGHRLRSELRLCVALICKNIHQIVRYSEHAPDRIDMQILPNAGNLENGHVVWRFGEQDESGTRLQLDAEIAPDFWVPPLVGPYLIARELRKQAQVTAEAIERLAHVYARDEAAGV